MERKAFTIVCGHYGSGKTNFALNLAIDAADSGKRVTMVDLDLINPYFRSSEYTDLLETHGVRMIAPVFANTTLDLPILSPQIASIFEVEGDVIVDVGGDDAGATVLGAYHKRLSATDYDMLYVVNRYRALSREVSEAEKLLREIEAASRLRATGVVNNSHLKGETTAQTVLDSMDYARACADRLELPLVCTTASHGMAADLQVENLYPIEVYVRSPWE